MGYIGVVSRMKETFGQWLRNSNRAAVFRATFEAIDNACMDEPALRIHLIEVTTRHASKAHHETDSA